MSEFDIQGFLFWPGGAWLGFRCFERIRILCLLLEFVVVSLKMLPLLWILIQIFIFYEFFLNQGLFIINLLLMIDNFSKVYLIILIKYINLLWLFINYIDHNFIDDVFASYNFFLLNSAYIVRFFYNQIQQTNNKSNDYKITNNSLKIKKVCVSSDSFISNSSHDMCHHNPNDSKNS